MLVITHYQRMLEELDADRVHLLVDGVIVDEGGPELGPARGRRVRRMAEVTDDPTWRHGRWTPPPWRRTSRSSPARSTAGRIIYLDSAASSQRPTAVLDAMREYDETTHANVHRGVYAIAEEATRLFEAARTNVGRFIGAPDPAREIVFTKNATEALNLVAHAWGAPTSGGATWSC